jgi:large repetitive protein
MPATMGRVRVWGIALIVFAGYCTACTKSPTAPAPQPPAAPPAGTAAAIFITPNSFDLPADGGSLELVIATAGNQAGNVVAANVPVTLEASSGSLSETQPRTDSTGHARVTWTGTTTATITARAGDVVGQATIRVAARPPTTPIPPPNPDPTPTPTPGPTPTPTPPPPPPSGNGVTVFWTSTPTSPVAGEPATFTATVSSRPDSPVVAFAWDFTEDGVTDDTSATPTHTFTASGHTTVLLTVTLADGRTAADGGGLQVKPAPTPAIATTLSAAPNAVAPGDTVTLTATATPNSTAGTVTSYEWDFDNNGTVDATTTTPTRTTTYSTIGTKTAKVTAKSATASGSATTTIGVSAPPLTISGFTASGSTVGSPVTFTVTVSSASLPPSMTFAWDYEGDDVVNETTSGASPRSVSHIYNVPGTYKVKVTVTAPDGRTVSGTAQVTVS